MSDWINGRLAVTWADVGVCAMMMSPMLIGAMFIPEHFVQVVWGVLPALFIIGQVVRMFLDRATLRRRGRR